MKKSITYFIGSLLFWFSLYNHAQVHSVNAETFHSGFTTLIDDLTQIEYGANINNHKEVFASSLIPIKSNQIEILSKANKILSSWKSYYDATLLDFEFVDAFLNIYPKERVDEASFQEALFFGALATVVEQKLYFFTSDQPDAEVITLDKEVITPEGKVKSLLPRVTKINVRDIASLSNESIIRYVLTQSGWKPIIEAVYSAEDSQDTLRKQESVHEVTTGIHSLNEYLTKFTKNSDETVKVNIEFTDHLPVDLIAMSEKSQHSDYIYFLDWLISLKTALTDLTKKLDLEHAESPHEFKEFETYFKVLNLKFKQHHKAGYFFLL